MKYRRLARALNPQGVEMRLVAHQAAAVLVLLALAAFAMPPSASAHDAGFFDHLPQRIQRRLIWTADIEEGSLIDWTEDDFQYPGGGVFNTGAPDEAFAEASTEYAHSGSYSAHTQINGAIQAQNGNRAVRLMRWTDTAWDNGGDYLPRRAYYSTWMYIPEAYNPNKYQPWDPGDGGFWNIFQFKANIEESSDSSVPMFAVNVDYDENTGENSLYMYSEFNAPNSFAQRNPVPLPIGEWVHIEALYVADTAENGGRIIIWQDGKRILRARNVDTIMDPAFPNATWGIGNYTNHIAGGPAEGSASIYFDDSAIARTRLSRWIRD